MEYINLMLIDKGYYDYDYQKPKEVHKVKNYDESARSDEDIKSILGRFGWGKTQEPTADSECDIQAAGLDFLDGKK